MVMSMTADGKYFNFVTEAKVYRGEELQFSYMDCRPPQVMLAHYGFFQLDHCFAVSINDEYLEYE